jgi:hypothetical protein
MKKEKREKKGVWVMISEENKSVDYEIGNI